MYLIDTSAWLNIDRRPDSEACWNVIYKLIKDKRIVICRRVLKELKGGDLFHERLLGHEDALTESDRDNPGDVEYLMAVGRVVHRFPGMSRARGEKTPADPYVVALAWLENWTVVVDETKTNRPNRKIPGACDILGVKWVPLAKFIADET